MRFESLATFAFLVLRGSSSTTVAFQAPCLRAVVNEAAVGRLQAVSVGGPETTTILTTRPSHQDEDDGMDMTGVSLSGLQGQALKWKDADYPTVAEIRRVLPEGCTEPDTLTSLAYLSVSVLGTVACTVAGLNMLSIADPSNILTWPLWTLYSAVTGTVAMGLWVLAHECGHGAFSNDKRLQDTVGYVLHSLFLVPYYSWQRSHAVHHRYTNHMELGETHVPKIDTSSSSTSSSSSWRLPTRASLVDQLGKEEGTVAWGIWQTFLHLGIGWPAYLLIGATGGNARGMTSHFYPEPLGGGGEQDTEEELFPGKWKEKVYKSDIGVAAVLSGLIAWAICNGPAQMMAMYGGPYLVVNAWLVVYTWLQHTDVDVPHFSDEDHNYIKGALHTIDRPYDKLDPYGLIDFLHHKIGTTHVAHHFDSRIPHYKAQAATDAIKEHFSNFYLYEPTPIPQAIWRIAKGTAAIEKRGKRWVWNNEGFEDKL